MAVNTGLRQPPYLWALAIGACYFDFGYYTVHAVSLSKALLQSQALAVASAGSKRSGRCLEPIREVLAHALRGQPGVAHR